MQDGVKARVKPGSSSRFTPFNAGCDLSSANHNNRYSLHDIFNQNANNRTSPEPLDSFLDIFCSSHKQNKHFDGFLMEKEAEVHHELPGETVSGQTSNQQTVEQGMIVANFCVIQITKQ